MAFGAHGSAWCSNSAARKEEGTGECEELHVRGRASGQLLGRVEEWELVETSELRTEEVMAGRRRLPVLMFVSFISATSRPSSKGQEVVVIISIPMYLDNNSTEACADKRPELSSRPRGSNSSHICHFPILKLIKNRRLLVERKEKA